MSDTGISMKFLLEKSNEEFYSEPEHQHQCYLLVYCKSGSGYYCINGINVPFKPNAYAVFPPSFNISEIGNNTVCLHLGFDYDNNLGSLSYGLFDDPSGELLCVLKEIQQELLNHDAFSDYYLESNLRILIYILKRNWQKNSGFGEAHSPRQLTDIVSYFNQNYDQPIDISKLFENMGYSYHHLRHVFKETYGVSPAQYLTQIRIDTAKKLLLTTELDIPEVSRKCGFKSPVTFNTNFIKSTGKSAEDFRNDRSLEEQSYE